MSWFAYTDLVGGMFKTDDNVVVDRSPDGSTTVRFTPVAAAETEFCTAELVNRYEAAVARERHHPVLLIGLFVLDLLTIHPFADVLATAYETFERRLAAGRSAGTKQERVRQYVLRDAGPVFRINHVRIALPGVSDQTIRLALETLKSGGYIVVDGTGRHATWRRTSPPPD